MTNIKQSAPEVILELDRKRRYCLDWNALRKLEMRLGKGAFREIDFEDPGINDFTYILWGGLLTDDPQLSIDDLCDMLGDVDVLERIKKQVVESVSASFVEKDKTVKKKVATTKAKAKAKQT